LNKNNDKNTKLMQKKKNKEEKGIKKSYFYDVFSVDWALKKTKKMKKDS
jgi:hypothetical protein